MSTRLANEIRETGTPIYCSACFNQDPSRRHVDFDAASDRGYGNAEATKVVMDDLILCEECLRRGAELVGMADAAESQAKIDSLEAKLASERRENQKLQRYAENLELAFDARPQPVRIDHRKRPREIVA